MTGFYRFSNSLQRTTRGTYAVSTATTARGAAMRERRRAPRSGPIGAHDEHAVVADGSGDHAEGEGTDCEPELGEGRERPDDRAALAGRRVRKTASVISAGNASACPNARTTVPGEEAGGTFQETDR